MEEVLSMIDLVLVKKAMLRYVQDFRVVKEMGRGLSYNRIVVCKDRLVDTWIKWREKGRKDK